MQISSDSKSWSRLATDVEVSPAEWLAEWNVPLAQRRITRPYCSVHWAKEAERQLLANDKVFRREVQSSYEKSLIHLLERNGRIVAVSEQMLWKMIE